MIPLDGFNQGVIPLKTKLNKKIIKINKKDSSTRGIRINRD